MLNSDDCRQARGAGGEGGDMSTLDQVWFCHTCYVPLERGQIRCSETCKIAECVHIGRRLALARMQLGLTVGQMAGRLEMTRRAYRDWELGRRREYHALWSWMIYSYRVPISLAWLLSSKEPMLYSDREMQEPWLQPRREAA